MSIDFESLRDKAVVIAKSGVDKAKELTDTGMAKVKELTEIGKLKIQNSSEQESIRKAYSELGKLYFAERGSAPEAAYAGLCQTISEAQAKIAYNNERIADIKAAGNLSDDEVQEMEAAVEDTGAVNEEPGEEPCCEEPEESSGE